MRETRRYSVYPSDLKPAVSFAGLLEHMKRCGYEEDPTACSNIKYSVDLPDSRSMETTRYTEFMDILSRQPQPKEIVVHSHWSTGKSGDLGCTVLLDPGSLVVTVESPDLNLLGGIHDTVRQLFQASNPPSEKSPVLRRFELKKSVFLAHRFDADGNAAAQSLSGFLRRLGFQVAEGEGYEAREIPAKVSERITSSDIFMCVVTPGDQSWILSEAAYAKALQKYIVLLCEDGVSFSKGILGRDYEYITYPSGVVEKSFTDLLYALP